ncbi:hypothetical protein CJU89_1556 [Yarrowia sp. B02]|nr:hypothetical protein CJU89_1556 [Yarrowia sp. B02]
MTTTEPVQTTSKAQNTSGELDSVDVENLVNAQKPETLKDRVGMMKAKKMKSREDNFFLDGVFSKKKSVGEANYKSSSSKTKSKTATQATTQTPSKTDFNNTIMTGNTSAAIDVLLNTSTPKGNSLNSFDSHTTQKAGSFNNVNNTTNTTNGNATNANNTNHDITNILNDYEKPLLPQTVLTDNKTSTIPDSPYYTDRTDVRIGSFDKKKKYNFGSDVSSAMENARRSVSEARKNNLNSYRQSNPLPQHTYRTPQMDQIRAEMEKEQSRDKQKSRDRMKQRLSKLEIFQSPNHKFNVEVPLDMSEETLFELICSMSVQSEASEAARKRAEEKLAAQSEEMALLRSKNSEVDALNAQLASKDSEIASLRAELAQSASFASLQKDYEHYKSQCYKKDSVISELEARIKREENLEEYEKELKDKEKRLVKTELRLGQQALEQDHERQKIEAEKKLVADKDEEERLRERLRELGGSGRSSGRSSRRSRESRSSRDYSRSRSRDYSRSRSRDYSSRDRYRRRSGAVDLKSQALEKVIDFLMARQKTGAQRAHMDACYNVSGPAERYGDGLSDATVEKVLKEFLNKDEEYLEELMRGGGKRLDDYLASCVK